MARAVVGSLVMAVLVVGAPVTRADGDVARYAYVVGCGATVDKLDTSLDRKVASYNLARRTEKKAVIPATEGGFDGCLANQTLFDKARSLFYVVAPVEARSRSDGSNDYRVLGFSIPAVQLVSSVTAGKGLDTPPRIALGPARPVIVQDDSSRTALDLSSFAPAGGSKFNQILESSGDAVLVRLFTANEQELVLAVADTRARKVQVLTGLLSTVAGNAHLAPGGAQVLVEETKAGTAERSGKLALYDGVSGRLIRELSDRNVAQMYFLAIAPSGKAIYHKASQYGFVPLGMTFAATPVAGKDSAESPGVFFSDR